MKIGYIGLGAMGGALARRLLKSHPLTVWDLQPAATQSLAQAGAVCADSPADLARHCDVVLTCLPRSANVRELLFGQGRMAEVLSSGTIIIDQTSGDPAQTAQMAQELAPRGITLLDAPVSGGQKGADAGTIAIMVAGMDAAYQQVLPILHSISPNVDYCGPQVGNAHAMKLLNNTVSGSTRLATLELVALGRKLGLSLAEIASALDAGDARNKTTGTSLPALLQGRPAVSEFALALLLKDINLGTGLGMGCGAPMPISNVVRSYHEMALNTLGPTAQLAQLVGFVEGMAGTMLTHTDAPMSAVTATDKAVLAKLLTKAVATCNLLITYECAAVGVRYGLSLDLMARVILKGGAWNGAAERVLPVLSAGGQHSGDQLKDVHAGLVQLTHLARSCGAPLNVCDLVRCLVEAGRTQLGAQDDLDAMANVYERFAGVRFAGA